ncbi:ester cyclase [Streptomyces celluloflavus]|uniref:ester cyclase n=1 Tax=Streptomyces celluloflavus TaxID=58344 RepID=UPI0036A9E3B2
MGEPTRAYRGLVTAMNTQDVNAVAALLAADVNYREIALAWDMHNRAEYRRRAAAWFDNIESRFEIRESFESGNRGCSRWSFAGRVKSPVPGLIGTDAVGRKFRLDGVSTYAVDQRGLLIEVWDFWNLTTLLDQVTAADAPATDPLSEPK